MKAPCDYLELIYELQLRVLVNDRLVGDQARLNGVVQCLNIFFQVLVDWRNASDLPEGVMWLIIIVQMLIIVHFNKK